MQKYGIPLLRYTVFLKNCPLEYDPKDGVFFDGKNSETSRSAGGYGVRGEDVKLQSAHIREDIAKIRRLYHKMFKKQEPHPKGWGFVGAGNQNRTDDLVITNDVLYRLSHTSNAS